MSDSIPLHAPIPVHAAIPAPVLGGPSPPIPIFRLSTPVRMPNRIEYNPQSFSESEESRSGISLSQVDRPKRLYSVGTLPANDFLTYMLRRPLKSLDEVTAQHPDWFATFESLRKYSYPVDELWKPLAELLSGMSKEVWVSGGSIRKSTRPSQRDADNRSKPDV